MSTKSNITPDPWERQEGESTKAYEAFCTYRDMGRERSLSKVAAKLQKSETLMGRWSGAHEWVDRAAKWDDEQERIERETAQREQVEAIKKMRKRHAKLAENMLEKAASALAQIPEEEIRPADISRMVDIASKLERISRGDVGEVVEERDGGQAMSPVQIYIPDNHRGKSDETFDDLNVEEE